MTSSGIQISEENPRYWEYDGELTLLLGASDNDCLFQWFGDRLTDHLDDVEAVGGNWLRNTMSIRAENAAFPFASLEDDEAQYDLDEWNDEYWRRLDRFLEETQAREIIVGLTLWDQHDFGSGLWEIQPWNPENNVNYDVDTGVIGGNEFYSTVENGVDEVLEYQERFVRKILDISLTYDHVIYNVNNESTVPYKIDDPKTYDSSWERHWAQFVHDRADEAGVEVDVTNMMMQPHHSVAVALKHPELYSYVEISQLNQDSQGRVGQAHWDALQDYQAIVEALGPRPLNTVKLYGSENPNPSAGTADEAIDRFWRLILGGGASARFHRPGTYGLGLVDRTKSAIRSMRMIEEDVDVFSMQPAEYLIPYTEDNEAYCAARPGAEYVVYIPGPEPSEIAVDLTVVPETVTLRWLDVEHSAWHGVETFEDREHEWIDVKPPAEGKWALTIHVE